MVFQSDKVDFRKAAGNCFSLSSLRFACQTSTQKIRNRIIPAVEVKTETVTKRNKFG
jgi:hypothetical protein